MSAKAGFPVQAVEQILDLASGDPLARGGVGEQWGLGPVGSVLGKPVLPLRQICVEAGDEPFEGGDGSVLGALADDVELLSAVVSGD